MTAPRLIALPVALLLAWSCAASAAFAQPAAATSSAGADIAAEGAGTEADHAALRALKDTYEKAVHDRNVELVMPHLSAEFTGVMATGESITSTDQLRAYWKKIHDLIGDGGSYTVTVKPERSVILGDLAIARGTTDDHVTTSGGSTYDFTTGWTAVCQREGGEWKIRRIEGTMDPITNPFAMTMVKRTAWWSGGIGAGVGLVLGIVIMAVLRRGGKRTA